MAEPDRSLRARRAALGRLCGLGAVGGGALGAWPPALAAPSPMAVPVSWRNRFEDGLAGWQPLSAAWGLHNHQVLRDPAVDGRVLRVHLQRGGIDPGSMQRRGLPRSGSGFKARVIAGGSEQATLRYRLRFAPGFDFVRGGKLPGLFGGRGNAGGAMPDGHDGFSLRLMWRERGAGEVYAYLPQGAEATQTGARHGRSLLRGHFAFQPGQWHAVTQEVVLNTPGQDDGSLRLWLDGRAVGEVTGLRLRDTPSLRLDGIFFDVFFGGSDDSWAPPADTHVDFAEFDLQASAGRPR